MKEALPPGVEPITQETAAGLYDGFEPDEDWEDIDTYADEEDEEEDDLADTIDAIAAGD